MASSVSAVSSTNQGANSIGEAEAISRIRSLREDQVLIVDFDQTFFLRNSSQEFIRMAKPYIFGAVLYKLLEVIHPWSWFADEEKGKLTRDWFHIWAITIFFPWTWVLWRMHATKMASVWTNQELANVLKERDPKLNILSTQGFGPIVRPLLEHMGVDFGMVSACRLVGGYSDRVRSKVDSIGALIGQDRLKQSAVVTDSEDDRDLLNSVEVPLLLIWPPSPIIAVTSHYIPFYYLCKIKLGSFARIFREVLYVDLLLLYLAFSWISPLPILHGIGITLLYMSFLLIYEVGYMENDDVGFELEKDPIIGDDFEQKKDYINYLAPWLWSIPCIFTGSGVLLLVSRLGELGIGMSALISEFDLVIRAGSEVFFTASQFYISATWLGLLVSMRFVYKFYNYTDKMTRTWIYPLLQIYKSIAFMFVSPINMIGAVALFCQVVARSFAYFIYRWSGKDWPGSELYLLRLFLFVGVIFTIGHALENRYSEFYTFQALAIAIWMSSRALKPIVMVFKNMKHVANDTWTKSNR